MKQLIFVYNAHSGMLSQASDYIHKLFKPNTYQCNLCAVTYGNLGMKSQWKNYVHKLEHNVVFLHRDELKEQYPQLDDVDLPAVFRKVGNHLKVMISANELNAIESTDVLIDLVTKKIMQH